MIENRMYQSEASELRAFTDGDKRIISGYAAKYNVESRLLSESGKMFTEVLAQGAFRDVTSNDVYLTFNHNRDQVFARTTNGTLTLTEDEVGLRFQAELNDTTGAIDLYKMVERGDVFENSFAFTVDATGQSWNRAADGRTVRTISRVTRLFDVSVVTHAAYPDTEVSVVRGLDEYIEKQDPITINDEPYRDMVYLLKLKNN